ncbi:MAG: bifunctional adenosylcobinamide kinase/adenosylcobinamide-phosphate guanylyltransferase [Candidatus Omnitrophota bacterium]
MILILGGTKSGKSRFAVDLAKRQCRKVVYLATAPVCDKEMEKRVARHRKSRPASWKTIEIQKDALPHLRSLGKGVDGVIFECLGTYIANLLMSGQSEAAILKNVKEASACLKKMHKEIFIVSNEVGGSLIPQNKMGRRFTDIIGRANQMLAQESDSVYLVTAGLPLRLK